jgi:hypothetical protein
MQFRITQKLGKKIKTKSLPEPKSEIHPYLDWVARLFYFRSVHYILITHRTSLLSTVALGKGLTNAKAFSDAAHRAIRQCLFYYRFETIYDEIIQPETKNTTLTKIQNRRINGCMNELVYNAQWDLHDGKASSTLDMAILLNEIIQCSLEHKYSVEEFAAIGSATR